MLVTGGTGQVGAALAERGRGFVFPGRDALDLADEGSIAAWFTGHSPGAVINCAAYTAVDKAESDIDRAWAVNAVAPGLIAGHCAARGIPLVHLSTDYVFDGLKVGAYVENDPVAPLGVYGASKEAGERAVREASGRHIILRTAWVISPWGVNFVKTMLRLGAERPELGIVDDQLGCPTSAIDIGETAAALTRRLIADPAAPTGAYHFVNAGQASWYELARAIFAEAAARGLPVPILTPIATRDYPTPARRPLNSRLDTARISADFGIDPRPWRAALAEILARLLPAGR